MIPIFARFRFSQNPDKYGFLFPVILVWLLLAALLLVLLPFFLVGAAVTWKRGPGRFILLAYPMIFSVLWHLSGLHIEIGHDARNILIAFL